MRTAVITVALLLAATAAGASPYVLADIPQAVPRADADKLKAAGIDTTDQLLARAATQKARGELARATGVAEPRLRSWAELSDLVRIAGVGPEVVRLLAAVGVANLAQLQRQDPQKLADAVTAANAEARISLNPPTVENWKAWVAAARKLPVVLKP